MTEEKIINMFNAGSGAEENGLSSYPDYFKDLFQQNFASYSGDWEDISIRGILDLITDIVPSQQVAQSIKKGAGSSEIEAILAILGILEVVEEDPELQACSCTTKDVGEGCYIWFIKTFACLTLPTGSLVRNCAFNHESDHVISALRLCARLAYLIDLNSICRGSNILKNIRFKHNTSGWSGLKLIQDEDFVNGPMYHMRVFHRQHPLFEMALCIKNIQKTSQNMSKFIPQEIISVMFEVIVEEFKSLGEYVQVSSSMDINSVDNLRLLAMLLTGKVEQLVYIEALRNLNLLLYREENINVVLERGYADWHLWLTPMLVRGRHLAGARKIAPRSSGSASLSHTPIQEEKELETAEADPVSDEEQCKNAMEKFKLEMNILCITLSNGLKAEKDPDKMFVRIKELLGKLAQSSGNKADGDDIVRIALFSTLRRASTGMREYLNTIEMTMPDSVPVYFENLEVVFKEVTHFTFYSADMSKQVYMHSSEEHGLPDLLLVRELVQLIQWMLKHSYFDVDSHEYASKEWITEVSQRRKTLDKWQTFFQVTLDFFEALTTWEGLDASEVMDSCRSLAQALNSDFLQQHAPSKPRRSSSKTSPVFGRKKKMAKESEEEIYSCVMEFVMGYIKIKHLLKLKEKRKSAVHASEVDTVYGELLEQQKKESRKKSDSNPRLTMASARNLVNLRLDEGSSKASKK